MFCDNFVTNWWSKKWLESLFKALNVSDNIIAKASSSRICVRPFEINDHRVIADVCDEHSKIHNVYLVFSKFDKEHSDVFLEVLKQQPAELIALKNSNITHSLEMVLGLCGLSLFDTEVKCACDCKNTLNNRYVIALLLALAKKIDNDPLLILKLHCFDIEQIKNINAETVNLKVFQETDLVHILAKNNRKENPRICGFKFDEWRDYSTILPAMLSNCPDFCAFGNFKKSYIDELERSRIFYNRYEEFAQFATDFGIYHAKTFFIEKESLQIVHEKNWIWNFTQFSDGKIIANNLTIENVMGALCRLNSESIWHYHVTVQFLYSLIIVAFYLVRLGAIYPQVFWIKKYVAQIRWLPAKMLPDVFASVIELEKSVPINFAFTIENGTLENLDNAAEHILSLFINKLLRFSRTAQAERKSSHQNLLSFFFDCKAGRLDASNEVIPQKIQQWLFVYNSLDFNNQIIFQCNDYDDKILLEVFVEKDNVKQSLAELYESRYPNLLSLMNILNSVAEIFEPLQDYLKNQGSEPIFLEGAELKEFVVNSVEKIKIFGITVVLPESLLKIFKPKAQVFVSGNFDAGFFNTTDLLEFDWQVAIGDDKISAKDFLTLTKNAKGLLKYKNKFVEYSIDDIEKLKARLKRKEDCGNAMQSNARLLQSLLTGIYEDVPVNVSASLKEQLDFWRAETDIILPENLNAKLRPYQERGFSWLYKNLQMGFGCILADDMGLGKTLQVIAILLKLKQENKFRSAYALIVVPAGLLCNWQMEIKKFAPQLTVFAYHGQKRDLSYFKDDLLLTTYSTCRIDFEKLEKINWQIVIIDEAQNIKNANSDQSKKIRKLNAPMKVAMSGTPVENRLMEFWTIMDFCNHDFLPKADKFREQFETPIQNGHVHVAEMFKKITAPFMLRRMKTDKSIISDLPDKIEQDEFTELTRTQAALYQSTVDKVMEQLQTSEDSSLFKRKGLILNMILALKQICNHPKTFLKSLDLKISDSGKLNMLLDLLESILEQNEKTLIFTQFLDMGLILQKVISEKFGIKVDFYNGTLSQTERNSIVQNFQNNPENKILVLTLKSAGTGLNLTAASQVIHYDMWWNPAVEAQATDRAFRIGQTKNVQVHRFITKGTFEEKINEMLQKKKEIMQLTVNAGETWISEMNDKQLTEIFTLDSEQFTL